MKKIILVILLLLIPLPALASDKADISPHPPAGVVETLWKLRATDWVDRYTKNQWDCSNMSATLAKVYQGMGLNASIVVFSGEKVDHAMVVIRDGNKEWYVEATLLSVWITPQKRAATLTDLKPICGSPYVEYRDRQEVIAEGGYRHLEFLPDNRYIEFIGWTKKCASVNYLGWEWTNDK